MIDSETINFNLLGYGKFMINYKGLKYLGNFEGIPYDEGAEDLTESFNNIYTVRSHITPREGLDFIPAHFLTRKKYIQNVEITNEKEIEPSSSDLTY